MSNARNLASIASRSADLKAGTTAFFAMSSAPTGWIKANGAAVSRTVYADLYAAIGTTFGTGDGSTTFNLPDLRGYFPRGFDDGAGVDSGRALGTTQADGFANHYHNLTNNLAVRYGAAAWNTGGGVQGTDSSGSIVWQMSATQSTGGVSETRPKNIALLACIKY